MKMNPMLATGLVCALGAGVLLQSTPSLAAPTVASKNIGLDAAELEPIKSFTWTEFGGVVAGGALAGAVGTALIGAPAATAGAVAGGVAAGAGYVAQTVWQDLFGSDAESE
jgi:hypothetical protein